MLLGGRVEVLPPGAAAGIGPPRLRIDVDIVQLREVENDSVVTGGEAGDAVAAAAYRDRLSFASGKTNGSRDIVGGRRSYDQGGSFVDRVVSHAAGRLVARVARTDHRTGQAIF